MAKTPAKYDAQPVIASPLSRKHTVSPGQTIHHVAAIHRVSPDAILTHPANRHLLGGGPLLPGMRLVIP